MRVIADYRPALRDRSGVGEYVHQVARSLAQPDSGVDVTLFTSSWKDRPQSDLAAIGSVRISDHRIPVSLLNVLWHRLERPSIEWMTHARYDVAFSPHPLLMPARHAARVVMVHDLDFLDHPERTRGEIRRDYPALAASHANRADRVIVPSGYTGDQVVARLGVPREHVAVCPPGIPEWRAPVGRFNPDGYALFMGTLEPRKNLGGLLEAYGRIVARRGTVPKLVLAGGAGAEAGGWLEAIGRPPLAGHVEHIGYVRERDRQRVYAGARVLVLPSFDEGFGMPALEAMSLGIPVVASRRGALTNLVGDAGVLVEPDDVESIANGLEGVLTDAGLAQRLSERGLERARPFRWQQTACAVRDVFQAAIAARLTRLGDSASRRDS
ncbi:MAG TPA: glycosyltransferase family 1 protein [Gemmatimonadaceae bacterium]|nr:glycosyltransferase family 1 protein [Gemmatimonadaceae bacterium]